MPGICNGQIGARDSVTAKPRPRQRPAGPLAARLEQGGMLILAIDPLGGRTVLTLPNRPGRDSSPDRLPDECNLSRRLRPNVWVA